MKAVTESMTSLCLLGLLGLIPGPALAEKADRQRPIQIEADSVRMDDSRKTAVYEGNVVLAQGTLLIKADRLDVRQDDKGMSSGEATGRPVHFRQKVEGKDEYVEAQASRLEYDAHGESLKLSGAAHLKQGMDELRGGLIVYDMRTELYRAQGSETAGQGQGRVRAVLRPRSQMDGAADKTPAKP